MKKYLLLVPLLLTLSTGFITAQGLGSTLTGMYSGSGSIYNIWYSYYSDCAGISSPITSNVYYSYIGNPATATTLNQTAWSVMPGSPCYNISINCAGGQGIQQTLYDGNVSLNAQGLYRIYTYEGSGSSYTEAYITVDSMLNDYSPQFNMALPEFYFCNNTPTTFLSNVSDPDGDSIVYSLIAARVIDTTTNVITAIQYPPSLSPTNFLHSSTPIIFNSSTGAVTFTPNQIGPGVMVVKADEYRNNIWIGSVMREVHFVVINGVSSVNQKSAEEINIYPNPVEISYI